MNARLNSAARSRYRTALTHERACGAAIARHVERCNICGDRPRLAAPRLVFNFDRRSNGRLRKLIDTINGAAILSS